MSSFVSYPADSTDAHDNFVKLLAGTSSEDPGPIPYDYFSACTEGFNKAKKIGEGVFGDVYLAVDPSRSLQFVVKKINLQSLATISDTPESLGEKMRSNEIVALSRFRGSPFIVKLIGFTEPSNKQICLAYEHCAGGALDKILLDDDRARELTYKQRVRVALGIAKVRGGEERRKPDRSEREHGERITLHITLTN